MADMSAYIRSLISPAVGAPQWNGDVMSGARSYAALNEQKRANEAQEKLRGSEQQIQRDQMSWDQQKFAAQQADEHTEEQIKAQYALIDALASGDQNKIDAARTKAQLVGADAVPIGEQQAPLQGPLDAQKQPGGITLQEDPDDTEAWSTQEPLSGGRLLGPEEKPEWAGDEKPAAFLTKEMQKREKVSAAREKPPPGLSSYMESLGVLPSGPTETEPMSLEEATAEESSGDVVGGRSMDAPEQKGIRGGAQTWTGVRTDNMNRSGRLAQQAGSLLQEGGASTEPQKPQTVPVNPGGYMLMRDGKPTGVTIPKSNIVAIQREQARSALAPLLANATTPEQKAAATTAIQIADSYVPAVGVDKAVAAGMSIYDKAMGRQTAKEVAATRSWAQSGQQDFRQSMAKNRAYETFVTRYQAGHKIPEVRAAAEAALQGSEMMNSDNPAEQRIAAGMFVKAVSGPGVLSDFDFRNALNSGGRWNEIQRRINEWVDSGKYPANWRQLVHDAQQEVRRAKNDYLHKVAVTGVNEMMLHPDIYSEDDHKAFYTYITGSGVSAGGSPNAGGQGQQQLADEDDEDLGF